MSNDKKTELEKLIQRLQKGIVRSASYIKTIKYPQLLINGLQELNDLIGNEKVKDSVATQVSHLIMIKRRAMDDPNVKEDEVMLNTALYGSPGTGKTTIGMKLAKIWYALGYIDGSKRVNTKDQKVGDILKDMYGSGSSSNSNDNYMLWFYIMFIFIVIFISIISLGWSFYTRFGGMITLIILMVLFLIIIFVGYYVSSLLCSSNNNCPNGQCPLQNNNINTKGIKDNSTPIIKGDMPTDDQIIKVVTRADFIDKYVGWTSPKTNKLLEENLGKVLFVDEAYSLINGPHDEFGMEALTTLNLFLSQHSKEIIIIFAGYQDLLEAGPYAVQPGLKRRFMWQFDCSGYNSDQLFEIFKMQLNKKGWGLTDEKATLKIFENNIDAFPAFGGDCERAGFFAELEHSRDYLSNESKMEINKLEPRHVERGIAVLRENNIKENKNGSNNPLANMMKMMSNNKSNNPDMDLINAIRNQTFH